MSDSSYFVTGANNKNWQNLLERANGDLWESWDDAERHVLPQCKMKVEKIKAHAELQALRGEIGAVDFVSNSLADAAADAWASSQVNNLLVQDYEHAECAAYMIARRLAILEAERRSTMPLTVQIPKFDPDLGPIGTLQGFAEELQQRVREIGHVLLPEGRYVICQSCRMRRKAGNVQDWARKPCLARTRESVGDRDPLAVAAPQEEQNIELVTVSRASAKKIKARRETSR